MRQLLDNRPYRTWLARVPEDLTAPLPSKEAPVLDWGLPPRLPPWVTPGTVETIRKLIQAEAHNVEPLSSWRGQHRELVGMQGVCCAVRQVAQMAEQIGLTLAAPYYDDRVIEAGLAVRPQERVTPWRYKPLIVEAMRGIVPSETLTRSTKAAFTYAEQMGLREHRATLLTLCEESRLSRLGLIDADALRAACRRPLSSDPEIRQTMACEIWLRALEASPVLN